MTALNYAKRRRQLGGIESAKIVYGGQNDAATFNLGRGPGVGELLVETGQTIYHNSLCMVTPWKSIQPASAIVDVIGAGAPGGNGDITLAANLTNLSGLIVYLVTDAYTIQAADIASTAALIAALAAHYTTYQFHLGGPFGVNLVISKGTSVVVATSTSSTANTILGLTAATYATNTRDCVLADLSGVPGNPVSVAGDS